jgi:hypothetical protein
MTAKLIILAAGALMAATTASAQPAPAAPPSLPPLQTPNPHYATIVMEMDVNKPAAEVWARVGKYCDLGEWFRMPCKLSSGVDGQIGAVRELTAPVGTIIEILVGRTELSYTYTQPVRVGPAYNMYHGTLEARPVSATTSKLVYTLLFDNSGMADDAARAKDIESRRVRFTDGLKNMKILAEGGTLPPAP